MSVSALENLLAAGEWRAADEETRRLLLEEGDRGGFAGLDPDEVLQLDCTLLTGIDVAWRTASDGRYGLSVQSELLSAIRAEGHPRKTTWRLFGTRVGWVKAVHAVKYSDHPGRKRIRTAAAMPGPARG